MTGRRWTLVVHSERLYTGASGWRAKEVFEKAGYTPRWDDDRRCWYVFGRKVAEGALIALERCGAALRIEGEPLNSTPAVVPSDGGSGQERLEVHQPALRHRDRDDAQLDLFGGGDAA